MARSHDGRATTIRSSGRGVGLRLIAVGLALSLPGLAMAQGNSGPTIIDLSAKGEKVTRGPEQFSAKALSLGSFDGNVTVEVGSGPGLSVTIVGPKSLVDAFALKVVDGTLMIDGPKPAGGENISVTTSGGRSVVVVNGQRMDVPSGNVVVRGGNASSEVKVTVPKGTPVAGRGLLKSVSIGDVEAPVRLTLVSADVTTGSVTDAQVSVNGAGQAVIGSMSGNLSAEVGGAGSVHVKGGQIGAAFVSVDGTGSARIEAPAQTARVQLGGVGSVELANVAQKPRIEVTGVGDVTVGNWPDL